MARASTMGRADTSLPERLGRVCMAKGLVRMGLEKGMVTKACDTIAEKLGTRNLNAHSHGDRCNPWMLASSSVFRKCRRVGYG